MKLTRRGFFKASAATAALSVAPIQAFASGREPYVKFGQDVSYVGLNLHPDPCFTGSDIVTEVLPWNGECFPVLLREQRYRRDRGWSWALFPDFDLADLDEVPADFWGDPVNDATWPNVHAYVRFRRFGERPEVMRARLRAAYAGLSWPHRAVA